MAQYSDHLLREIRSRVDVVDLVGQYVPLHRAGANHKGLCPFHKEKSPSFHVHPEKQIYRCFGCGASGNVFGFLMQYEGVSFPESVRMLADRAGVVLEKSGAAGPSRQLTDRLKEIHKVAAQLYEGALHDKQGEFARDYLKGRGMDLAMARELGLGYAPDSWDFARTALTRQGFETSELESSGLIKHSAENADRYYDRFRHRLMFPITDPYGVVIGFGGRTLGDDPAKYINSPESPLYHKGSQLFGLHLAREAVKEQGCMVLVEGNFDCVLPWSRGVKHVVASLGTALTPQHVRLVKRYTDRVILLFDQDDAGQTSQRRAAELMLGDGFEVRIATLDKHKDPADYVQLEGAAAFRKRLDVAEEAIIFYARREAEALREPTPRARARAVASMMPLIEKISDPIERNESLAYISEQLSVDVGLVRSELERKTTPHRPKEEAAPAPKPRQEPLEDLERRLLRALVLKPELIVQYVEQNDPAELQSQTARDILSVLSALHSDTHVLETSELLDRIESPSIREQIGVWIFEEETRELDVLEDFQGCVEAFQKRRLRQEEPNFLQRIREAEAAGDHEKAMKLALESISVSRERQGQVLGAGFQRGRATVPPGNRLK